MNAPRKKLTYPEIEVLLSLIKRGASLLPTTLLFKQRGIVTPLWRRQLVELWFRRPPAEQSPNMQGPFYRLTSAGAELALKLLEKRNSFNAAPRAISGAGAKS